MTRDVANPPRPAALLAALEYGPTIAFVLVYLALRNRTFIIGGTEYGGFIAVTALFIPVFVLCIALLWALTRRIARIQIATAILIVVFGGLGIWFNDPRLLMMKPTAIYLTLALLLGAGLLRGQSWLMYLMEDMIPLKRQGWMILTKRVTVLFILSAAANEVVWRTQSEAFWVLFETIAMPVIVVAFFVLQIGLYVEYATFKQPKKKKR